MKTTRLLLLALYGAISYAQPAFTAHTIQPADYGNHIAAGDLDEDGDIDLVSCERTSGQIRWHKNIGGGSFENLVIDAALPDVPVFAYIFDVDRDGHPDVVSSKIGTNVLGWYKYNADGTFTYNTVYQLASAGTYEIYAAPGDFDNDGDTDFVAGWYSGVFLFTNDGTGNFLMSTISTADAATPTSWVRAVDIDGDGDLDFVTASNFNLFSWYGNNGTGVFTYHNVDTGPVVYADRKFINFADIDQDGDIDLLGTFTSNVGFNDDKFVWYQNNGNEVFTRKIISADYNSFSRSAYYCDTADIDNDGDLDIIGTSLLFGYNWFENNGSEVFTGHWVAGENPSAVSCVAADFDNDGDLDIAGTRPSETGWFENSLITLTTTNPTPLRISVLPNPTCDYVSIASGTAAQVSARLFNARGTLLLTLENVTGPIDLREFAAGVYILKVVADGRSTVVKVLKE